MNKELLSTSTPMYFCTVSDAKHFPLLINLIGSIHRIHFYDTVEIGVFNLGMTDNQLDKLDDIQKIKVYELEKTNPQMFAPINIGPNRDVRGLFSWKPVVIKQALKNYPYVVYFDAGSTILRPITSLFKHIIEQDYFLSDCGHSIGEMTTTFLRNKFQLNQVILNQHGIDAGFMGISRKMYDSFIKPIYDLSFDINNFVDDGTCPNGYGYGRHDQTLFSIKARQLNLDIQCWGKTPNEMVVCSNNKKTDFIITHMVECVSSATHIFRSRWNIDNTQHSFNLDAIKRKSTELDKI